MKYFKSLILFSLLLSSIYYSIIIHKNETLNQSIKNDVIELSKIKYGLFNVDEWKNILSDIISEKVKNFNLKDNDRVKMKIKISSLLHNVIDEYEKVFNEEKSKTFFGSITKFAYKSFSAFDDIRDKIPMFSEQILNFLDEKQNRENLKKYLRNLIDDYSDETFSKTDYTIVNSIIKKHNYSNRYIAIKQLKTKLNIQSERLLEDKLVILINFILIILILQFTNKFTQIDVSILLFICFTFLFLGITLPMIEIDARVSKMDFTLLGNNINFENQVLFYKSKSIIEVVYLMISQSKIGVISVGILVLIFSVVFPIIKILSSFIWAFKTEFRKNKIINFFVHKSGKWSMADVFVIAILMSYIGFDGIINDQLNQLEKISTSFNILTTNQSNLMFGFFAFTAFVILGIFISQKLKRNE